jgi:transposase
MNWWHATGISHGSIHAILHDDLQYTSVLSRWVPHYLDANQRQQRVQSAADMLKFFQLHRRDISNRLVVVDEKWIYFRDVGTKNSNRAWVPQDDKNNRPTIPRRLQHEKKCMFLLAFCFDGKFVLHMLPHSATVDGVVYQEFLTKVRHSFHRRVTNPLDWNEIILQHDNARPHTAAPVREILNRKGVRLLHQPPYSPDFNILDRWIFARIENSRRGKNFKSEDEISAHITADLSTVSEDETKNAFNKLKNDLQLIIDRGGAYL